MERYDVLEVIGEGTYGVVFKCRDKKTKRIVAVKQFKNFQTNAYIRVTMLRELRVEQLLKGAPNVTQLLESFKQKDRLHLVMEYIPRSLLDVLEEVRHGLPEESLVVLLFTILLGIRSCHRNGIIHRDVKPENILVSDDGVAFLCDFGFCRPLPQQLQTQRQHPPPSFPALSQEIGASAAPVTGHSSVGISTLSTPNNTPYTYSGVPGSSGNSAMLSELVLADHQTIMTNYVATRWYRSPEMLLGMPSYTYAVDMWAVGAIMAEAIDGEPLLPGKTELEQLSLIQARVGDFPKAYEAEVRKRNGGILSLCALNPLAASSQRLNTKSKLQRVQRSSDGVGRTLENADAKPSARSYLTERYGGRISKDGMNLLNRLLRVDAAERITVDEAIGHPYFDDVRGRFDVTANSVQAPSNSEATCDKVWTTPSTPVQAVEQARMDSAAAESQEQPFPPLTFTGAVDSTSPCLSLSCAADGTVSPSQEAAPSVQMQMQDSLEYRARAGVDNNVEDSLLMASPLELSSRGSVLEWKAPLCSPAMRIQDSLASCNTSPLDSVSLSAWTSSEASATTAVPTGLREENQACLPQVHDRCPPDLIRVPPASETSSDHVTGAKEKGATGVSDSPPTPPSRGPALMESYVIDQSVTDREANHISANAFAVGQGTSQNIHIRHPAAPHVSERRDNVSQGARRLPERTSLLESGSTIKELSQSDIPSTNRSVPESSHGGDNAAAADSTSAVIDVNVSSFPSSQHRRRMTGKCVGDVTNVRRQSGRGLGADMSGTKSFSSTHLPSCSFEKASSDQPQLFVGSLPPARVHASSTHKRLSGRGDHAEKPRQCSGRLSTSRTRSSSCRDKAALSSASRCTHSNSPGTSGAVCNTRTDTCGHSSVTQGRRGGSCRGSGDAAARDAPSARSRVKEALPCNSERTAAQGTSDISVQKRQCATDSLPPPRPRYRARTLTAATGSTSDDSCRQDVPNPFLCRSSLEVSVSHQVSDARGGSRGKRGSSRFASLQLPREVRSLLAGERVTLLRDMESIEYPAGTPSAVEEVPPSSAALTSRWPEHADRVRNVEEEDPTRNLPCAKGAVVSRVQLTVPASKPPGLLDNDLPSFKSHDRGEGTPSVRLADAKSSFSVTTIPHASAARRDSAASQATSVLAERTASRSLQSDGETPSSQQTPHPGAGSGMRTPHMDLDSLPVTKNTTTASLTTDSNNRAAPSLIFRSSRTVSSPLKLSSLQPAASIQQGKGAPRDFLNSGFYAVESSLTPPDTASSGQTCRLTPALRRYYRLANCVGSHSLQASTSMGLNPLFINSALSPCSPGALDRPALSPTLSQGSQHPSCTSTRNASMEVPIISLSGTRYQRHLSDNPIELSLSEDVFVDSGARGSRGPSHRQENTSSLPATPFNAAHDDLETVMLRDTPPTIQHAETPHHESGPIALGRTPKHRSVKPLIPSTVQDKFPSSKIMGRGGDALPTPLEANGCGPTLSGSGIISGDSWHCTTPEFPVATLARDTDNVMSVTATPEKAVPDSVEEDGVESHTTRLARTRLGLSLTPPQPLLGGASVLSARQLHAGGGRKKSRLVL